MINTLTSTLVLFAVTPLLVTPLTSEIFELPKTIFLYLITGIYLMSTKGKFYKTSNIPLNLIFLVYVTSTLFSIDKYTSVFGYYTRFYGGLLSIFCVLILTNIISIQKLHKNYIKVLHKGLIASGMIVALYAILQKAGIDKGIWKTDPTLRVFSTLGQPNWLAAYLIPTFFLSLAWMLSNKNKIYSAIPILIYTAFWFTYSFSGLIGFFISLGILVILTDKSTLKKNLKQVSFIFSSCLLISVLFLGTYKRRLLEFKENLIPTAHAQEKVISKVKTGDTANIRLILWKGTWDLITSSPKQFLIGSGPQTFAYAFPKFRPYEINETSEGRLIHNKPHNWYLEIWSNLGVIGLLTYIVFILISIKSFLSKTSRKHNITRAAFFTGWISILITNFWGWPTTITGLMFFMWPIFFTQQQYPFKPQKLSPFLLNSVGGLLIFLSLNLLSADYFYEQKRYDIATAFNPLEPRYELKHILSNSNPNSKEIKQFYYKNQHNPYVAKSIINYMAELVGLNPDHKNFKLYKGTAINITSNGLQNSPNDQQIKKIYEKLKH